MRTGLAMEGGAMRGMFTAGVIDVLMENHITFDAAAGISAGAVFGCNIKSNQIGRVIRYNKKYCRDPRYCSLKSWLTTGNLYGREFCYSLIPNRLDPFDAEAFRNNPMKFYVGTTDVDTGKTVYFSCKNGDSSDIEKMRASASMPIVSKIVEISGHRLLDGGVTDPVPLRYLQCKGYDRDIVILTQPKGYRKAQSKAAPLIHFLLRKYPALAHAMDIRYLRYNKQMDEIDKQETEGKIITIRPPHKLEVGKAEKNPDKLEEVYQIGRKQAESQIEKVKMFLQVAK
ncbi:MAG: patatin family protein [Eubacterium sp.]|nr:patatin family protein [Eubacterium sp.]